MSDRKLTGMHIYYYFVCLRKLWYFSNQLSMESENENVRLGKIIDETTYKNQNKHILIDDTINIDYISEYNILHEVKKSKKIEEAGIWQIKYYLYYLKKLGVTDIKGRVDYPLIKQSVSVELTSEDQNQLDNAILSIKDIISADLPPAYEKKKYCKSCAYYDLCC
ncbi:MAG: CRISPR-associated protein Cas4, partial [Clostridiales bacterium]|nr:CRISPR-associated protein Cas4 [Clostridiales bacterium]